jgi:PKD repeat protein
MRVRGWTRVCVLIALTLFGKTQVEAASITVEKGGNLQAAINAAEPGDTILLEAGAEFIGNFILPPKTGDAYITIRSSTSLSRLPGPGHRITPAHAPLLARIRSGNSTSALLTDPGAHHWRLQYLEFAAVPNGYSEIIRLGDGSSAQSSLSMIPHHFILDHLYVHGDPQFGQKRGIAINVAHFELRDSYISDIKAVGQDAQAVCGWNGPGPFTIENNYLEASGENVIFTGSPYIVDMEADGVVIRRNHIARPMTWKDPIISTPQNVQATAETTGSLPAGTYAYRIVARGPIGQGSIGRSTASTEAAATVSDEGAVTVQWQPVSNATEYRVYGRAPGGQSMYWTVKGTEFVDTGSLGVVEAVPTSAGTVWSVKNLFELKAARNVLVEQNIFENHWKQSQPGWAIVLTPRSSGGCWWCTVENVTFQQNLVNNVSAGINILGYDNTAPSGQARNLTFRQNLFTGMRKTLGGNAYFMQIGDGPRDITIDHNTIDSDGNAVVTVYGGTSSDPEEVHGFQMTNNASRHGLYGMHGTYFTWGLGILNAYYPDRIFSADYLAGAPASRYPAGTLVAGPFEAQFVDPGGGDFTVRADSILYRAATDGSDVGVDFGALMAAVAGVREGMPGVEGLPSNQAPAASFNADCSGLTCTFTDASTDADGSIAGWSWNFADGAPSSLPNPVHTFAAAGTYPVSLTVTDDDGASTTTAHNVTVSVANAAPLAAFTWTCSNLACTFTNTSTDEDGTIAGSQWTFGDGVSSAAASPSHTFDAAGTYTVSLTVVDDDGASASVSNAITVEAPVTTVAPSVHAGDLDGSKTVDTSSWTATVVIQVHDEAHNPVSGALVNVAWSNTSVATGACTTDTAGNCSVTSGAISLSTSATKMTVKSIVSTVGPYKSAQNHDLDGGSGTVIRVTRK